MHPVCKRVIRNLNTQYFTRNLERTKLQMISIERVKPTRKVQITLKTEFFNKIEGEAYQMKKLIGTILVYFIMSSTFGAIQPVKSEDYATNQQSRQLISFQKTPLVFMLVAMF